MAEIPQAFNSEEYGWKDMNIAYLGKVVAAIRQIRWKRTQDKQNVYGTGSEPIARTRGNIQYEGMIKLLLSEYAALLRSQGNGAAGAIKILPFDIIQSFAPDVGGLITTFVLKYVEFTEEGFDTSQGDQMVEVELPIIIGAVTLNA